MIISELQAQLEALKIKYGDVEVRVFDDETGERQIIESVKIESERRRVAGKRVTLKYVLI